MITTVTDETFDEFIAGDMPVMVDFWAVWCGYCTTLHPVLEQVATEYEGRVKVGQVDVDSNLEQANKYKVKGLPTVLVFVGGKLKDTIVGFNPVEYIRKVLDKYV